MPILLKDCLFFMKELKAKTLLSVILGHLLKYLNLYEHTLEHQLSNLQGWL